MSCGSAGQHSQVAAGRAQQSSMRALPHACRRSSGAVRVPTNNQVELRAVQSQAGEGLAGQGQQIKCTQLQLSGSARTAGSVVVLPTPADPMGFCRSTRDVEAQSAAKERKLLDSPWQTLSISFASTPIGQLHQSPPSPVPGDLGRCPSHQSHATRT